MYGCNNKPRPTKQSSYVGQAGWHLTGFRTIDMAPERVPVLKEVQSAFGTTDCQYDESATDKGCDNCKWRKAC